MILGLATNFLKSLGAKKAKSSGKKMAKNITNESEEKESVVKPSPPEKKSDVKGADLTPLEDIRDDMKASSGKSKDPLNLALDGIDSALFGIIDTLTKTNLLKKKIKSNENKEQQQDKKTLRERFLERGAGFVKGAVGTVKALTGSAWDKLMNFLTWTLLGAVVNYIIKNWESVKEKIIGMVEQLKEVFTRLKPILVTIKNIVLWFGTTAWDFIMQLSKAFPNRDEKIEKVKKELDNIDNLMKMFKGNSKDWENLQKELLAAKNPEETEKVVEKYIHLFDTRTHKPFDGDRIKIEVEGEEITMNEYRRQTYYIDQNGLVRKKKDNSLALMFMALTSDEKIFSYNLDKREYIPPTEIEKTNKIDYSTLNTLNLDNKSFFNTKDIKSYYLGLEEYDDDTKSYIMLLSEENETGMNYFDSDINFDYKMPESTLNIKDAFLLEKLNK